MAQVIHLSTCAWGAWHLDMLGRVMWPTALAPGNLPELARRYPIRYRICTTRTDRAKIESMPSFAPIAKLVQVEFDTDLLGETPEPALHMRWYVADHDYARDHGAIYLCLWPDVIFTANTLGHAADALDRGKAGAVVPTLRVVSETCVPDLLSRFEPTPGQAMALPAGEVVRLAVRHMHPLSAATFERARHGKPGTSMIFRVPGEGLIARSANTWLFMDPARIRFSRDGDIVTEDSDPGSLIHIAIDSDDMLFLSLAPLWKELETFTPGHATNALDIARMTLHPSLAASPFYDCFDRVSTRLHYGEMTETRWSPVERRANQVFARIAALRTYLRVWTLVKQHGYRRAAEIMSLALHTSCIARLLPRPGTHTFLIPSDEAFARVSRNQLSRALGRAARRSLVRALLDHALIGTPTVPTGQELCAETASGRKLRLRREGGRCRIDDEITVLDELTVAGQRVYIIDRLLVLPHGGSR